METLALFYDKAFSIEGIPIYGEILENGVGAYLKPVAATVN